MVPRLELISQPELTRVVDADRALIGEIVSPLIRNLPPGIQRLSEHLSGPMILEEVRRDYLLADFRMSASQSTSRFIDAVGRLATASKLVASAPSNFSATHAAVVLLLARPRESNTRGTIVIRPSKGDTGSLTQALLALATFEPLVPVPRDVDSAEASRQLADQIRSWRDQLRDCNLYMSVQQRLASDAETALHQRDEEIDAAERQRKERVTQLDTFLHEHVASLANGECGRECQETAYRLCRALNVRLPDEHLPILKRLAEVVRWRMSGLRRQSPLVATRDLREKVLAARGRILAASNRPLLADLERLAAAVDESSERLTFAEETRERARTAEESARCLLAEAEAERDGIKNVYRGLFQCGRSDCL